MLHLRMTFGSNPTIFSNILFHVLGTIRLWGALDLRPCIRWPDFNGLRVRLSECIMNLAPARR
jgi:hypothetical protein